MSKLFSRRPFVLSVAAVTALGVAGLAAPAAQAEHSHHHHHHARLYVSSHASARHHQHGHGSCHRARYATISAAVAAASAGDTVVVCRGTYAEDVMVGKRLNLVGRHATIDATGLENGIWIVTSHVSVRGLAVRNANGEGILVGADTDADGALLTSRVLTHVNISHVAVIDNNKGFNGTENGNCKYAGDCGGGIHLNVTAWSSVRHSVVKGNADGILLTDDYGPAYRNVIEGNWVSDNPTECGIVLPSHNPGAVSYDATTFAVTGRHPGVGGIYDNVVRGNVTIANGTAKAPPQFGGGGSGSGIGLFGSGPGTGVWNNLIVGNYSARNGLAGFTIHAHLPGGEDLNGNRVVYNYFGKNNLGGDGYDGPPGPTDFQTTGIAVYSAPAVHMTISHNLVAHNEIGIWLSKTVTAHGLASNTFVDVTTPVVTG